VQELLSRWVGIIQTNPIFVFFWSRNYRYISLIHLCALKIEVSKSGCPCRMGFWLRFQLLS
jgi:hypothetical protein